GSEYVPGRQQLALAAPPARQRPIPLEMDTEFFAPTVEGPADKVPIGHARGRTWRDMKKRKQLFAVDEPRRGDDRATASLYRLLFVRILRRDFEQQVSHPEPPFRPAPASVGTVECHGRPHPLQPIRGNGISIVPVNPIDAAHDRFRATLVRVLNRS